MVQAETTKDIRQDFAEFRERMALAAEFFGDVYLDAIPITIERLFGKKFEDWTVTDLANHLLQDKRVIYTKYGLPAPEVPYTERVERLYQLTKEYNIYVGDKCEREKFFQERLMAAVSVGAGDSTEPGLGIYLNRPRTPSTNLDEDIERLDSLQHELIHGIQNTKYPRMSIVQKKDTKLI